MLTLVRLSDLTDGQTLNGTLTNEWNIGASSCNSHRNRVWKSMRLSCKIEFFQKEQRFAHKCQLATCAHLFPDL